MGSWAGPVCTPNLPMGPRISEPMDQMISKLIIFSPTFTDLLPLLRRRERGWRGDREPEEGRPEAGTSGHPRGPDRPNRFSFTKS
jgi:hypothetical protein